MSEAVNALNGMECFWFWFGYFSSSFAMAAVAVGLICVVCWLAEFISDIRKCVAKRAKEQNP